MAVEGEDVNSFYCVHELLSPQLHSSQRVITYNDAFVLFVKKKVIELTIGNSLVFSKKFIRLGTGVDFLNNKI